MNFTKLLNILLQCDSKDDRTKRLMDQTKYDLSDAQDDFNLWDGVHGRDVLKYLEQYSKWEPGKKEREKRERIAFLAAQQQLGSKWRRIGR